MPAAAARRTARRQRPTIAVWPGDISGGRATYSAPGRPDHHDIPLRDVIVLRPREHPVSRRGAVHDREDPPMKYADLLQPAEPLESVKQIRESDTLETAKRDVETFVISDRMADQLTNIIIPALRFDGSGDTKKKGVFVVATYGTGKTHLMSVIGGVAEHESLRRQPPAPRRRRRSGADRRAVQGDPLRHRRHQPGAA